jgi:hypothetical protein
MFMNQTAARAAHAHNSYQLISWTDFVMKTCA